MFEVSAKLFKLVNTLRQAILSPLAMYELTEGNARDVHFAQTLPNEPLRLFFKHAQDVLFGSYTAELKGALTSSSFSSSSFTMQKFHEAERVRKKFFEEFTTAYNALVPEAAAAVAASVAEEERPPQPDPQKGKGDRQARPKLQWPVQREPLVDKSMARISCGFWQGNRMPTWTKFAKRWQSWDGERTVSYTHLTLPTMIGV